MRLAKMGSWLVATVIATSVLSACSQDRAGPVEIDRVVFSRENLTFKNDVLEAVPDGTRGNPRSGNHDAFTQIVAPGIIRLGVAATCHAVDEDNPSLCVKRNELRELQDERAAFRHPAFFAIQVKLAGAIPGARNDRTRRDRSQRLMVAQLKFAQAENTGTLKDKSPVLALRYEDDLLFVTTEMMGEKISRVMAGNRCVGGILALDQDATKKGGPFRVLLASENGILPYDFDPSHHEKVMCLKASSGENEALRVRGSASFPRQPRDAFFRLVFQIDGGTAETAYVRMFLNGASIVSAYGRLGVGVNANRSYFKFGPYATLPKGRQLSVDYADFRRAPKCHELGLTGWSGRERNDCTPKPH